MLIYNSKKAIVEGKDPNTRRKIRRKIAIDCQLVNGQCKTGVSVNETVPI